MSLAADLLAPIAAKERRLPSLLRLERLGRPEAIDTIAAEWDELAASISPWTPFSTPLWNRLWWHHLAANGWLLRDEFCLHTVRDGDGRLVGVAPLILTHRPGVGPLRARELQFFGADANLTEIRGLICRDDDHDAVLQALAAELVRADLGWHWLKWGRLQTDSPLVQEMIARGKIAAAREVSGFVLDLPENWPTFRANLPRNIKESLRKCYNSLKRDGCVFKLRVVDQPSATQGALDRFFRLHAARAKAPFRTAHRDIFGDPAARRFLTDYASHLAASDQLRIFELEVDGAVRASRIGFQHRDELYLYYSGYDPAWAQYSIMTTAVAEILKWAIEQRLRLVNLSVGSDFSKTRWRPRQVTYGAAIQTGSSRWAYTAFHALEAARDLSRRTPLVGQLRRLSRAR